MSWTRFMDMHSGGGCKEKPWEFVYIEASEGEAKVVFYNRFGHSPDRVSCTCCGPDYSVDESENLMQASAYDRGCSFREGRYVEEASADAWKTYVPFSTWLESVGQSGADEPVLLVNANEIKPDERKGEVPEEGYVWR